MQIIGFIGKGGVGKSTLCVETARCLSDKGRVVVIGLDQQQNSADIIRMKHLKIDHIEFTPKVSEFITYIISTLGFSDYANKIDVLAQDFIVYMNMAEAFGNGALSKYDYAVIDYPPNHAGLRVVQFPEIMKSAAYRALTLKERIKEMVGVKSESLEKIRYLHEIAANFDKVSKDINWFVLGIPTQLGFIETKKAYELLTTYGYKVKAAIVNMVEPIDNIWHCERCAARSTLCSSLMSQYDQFFNSEGKEVYQIPFECTKEDKEFNLIGRELTSILIKEKIN